MDKKWIGVFNATYKMKTFYRFGTIFDFAGKKNARSKFAMNLR